jgi:hypothetical protein
MGSRVRECNTSEIAVVVYTSKSPPRCWRASWHEQAADQLVASDWAQPSFVARRLAQLVTKKGSVKTANVIRDDSPHFTRRMRRVRTPFQSYVIPKILMIDREIMMFASLSK